MTTKTSLTTAGVLILTVIMAVIFTACVADPEVYLIRAKYGPEGSVLRYSMQNHRVGSAFINDEFQKEFETNSEAKITFTTKEVFEDGSARLHEENIWSWDEPANDSGKVSRKTKKMNYLIHFSPRNRMLDLEIMDGRKDEARLLYLKSYFEQMFTVFPEEEVPVGFNWTQSTDVTLPDSTVHKSKTDYTIKGTTQKNGYFCAIIEGKGKSALPVYDNPETETVSWGIDRIEVNEIIYFAIDEGIVVLSESKSRIIIEREYYYYKKTEKDKDGKEAKLPEKDWTRVEETLRQEIDETSKFVLEKIK
ncbi:MAG: hypothetical protein KAR42_04195 [candidate division Zixibacteria bacterium]|nr:hypothetical protein [candidate division Zixibacteria bacterium]